VNGEDIFWFGWGGLIVIFILKNIVFIVLENSKD